MINLEKRYDEFLDETIYSGEHSSGVKVYIMPKAGYSKSFAMFATKYGSIDTEFDIDGRHVKIPDGTAHFLEHKMFDMPDGSDAFSKFGLLGANANAFTSFDVTAYYFSATQNFKENLGNLIEFVQTPHFKEKSIQKEQGIIGQEIKMYDDDPNWRVFFNALDAMYQKNTVKLDIAGTTSSIATIDEKVLNDIYSVFYHPSNMILFVVGDFDEKDIADFIDKELKNTCELPKITRNYPNEPKEINKAYVEQKLSVAVPLFAIGFKDLDAGDKGDALIRKEIETQILINMLFSKSAPLYKKLYEAGLINESFGAEFSACEQFGHTLLEGESKKPKEVYEMIIEELSNLSFSDEDYRIGKNALWGEYIKMFNSTEAAGRNLTTGYLNGVDYLNYRDIFKGVTFEAVKSRAKKHFTKENSVLSIVLPID